MKTLCALLLVLSLACALPCALAEDTPLYVRAVEGLSEDFFMGMDVSSVLAEEASGVVYRDAAGNPRDLFELLAENGVNLIRVRVWNDPYDSQGRGFGGGNNDIDAAVTIGQRATVAGMRLLVDFHYSDFWADPSKQQAPRAWKGLDIEEKAETLRAWTEECLLKLRDAGVDVAMVQLGNETNGRFCGEKTWLNMVGYLMSAGSKAVRAVYPDALIAVHFANPENADSYLSYASKLDYYHLDYDVFGTSYYPYWHGTLDNLKTVLSTIRDTYGKQVMVMETSYAWTLEDGDGSGNTIGEGGAYDKPYPITVQGQVNEVTDVMAAMAEIGGIGVCYWEGAWVPVGRDYAENQVKWETYGSGWASSFAGEYDPDDAGKYYGGCACDNQTLFDFDGKALPSLAVFRLAREGQDAPLAADALEDAVMECDINGPIQLPETVSAIMNNNTRQAVPVAWEPIDEAALRAAGPASYTLHGQAGERQATLLLRMVKFNYVQNGGFEEDDVSMWRATEGGADQLYCEEKKNDSLNGVRHWHFYSATSNRVFFDLEQDITGLPAGHYDYSISIMGGDAGNTDIYSYVKINGETVQTAPTQITSWNNWFTPKIEDIAVSEGDVVTVGIHVRCDGAGAWGKIDDAELNTMSR